MRKLRLEKLRTEAAADADNVNRWVALWLELMREKEPSFRDSMEACEALHFVIQLVREGKYKLQNGETKNEVLAWYLGRRATIIDYHLNDAESAEVLLREAIELHPNNLPNHRRLFNALLVIGDNQKIEQQLEACCELKEEFGESLKRQWERFESELSDQGGNDS